MVRIVLLEKGLNEAVTFKWCDPWADDPTLVTEEGTTLSESMLIAVYLDSVYPDKPMLPSTHLREMLHLAGLGKNLMEAAFTTVIARNHYSDKIDDSVLGQRRWRAIQQLLKPLGRELGEKPLASPVNLGEIATAVALDYLAFRLPELAWKEEYPQLQAWHAGVTARVSFQQTAFV